MINLLLVSHGSRDPRPQQASAKLANLLKQKLSNATIDTAVLELGEQPLHQQITNFVHQLIDSKLVNSQPNLQINSQTISLEILILPLFLLPGVHVMEDIPHQVNLARSSLESSSFSNINITLQVLPHLGSHSGMFEILIEQQIATKAIEEGSVNPVNSTSSTSSINPIVNSPNSDLVEVWILLAHGSKYHHAHQPIKTLAQQINAIPAYWAVSPSLETCVEMLVAQGYQTIGILPYFLFSGGITDAIAKQINSLQQQFTHVQFKLASPISATNSLGDLILDLLSTKTN
ncbi:MAG: sirohydrochlorin chelatase [Coleofasciculaceae cyanobacterium SM2_1_6]|nr:sirohydrochlorin chelatase [Coleofasciculaceae cyanobacterium SM2_1_6]